MNKKTKFSSSRFKSGTSKSSNHTLVSSKKLWKKIGNLNGVSPPNESEIKEKLGFFFFEKLICKKKFFFIVGYKRWIFKKFIKSRQVKKLDTEND